MTDLLDRNGGWIEFADAKAGAVLAFVVVVVGVVVSPATDAACVVADSIRDGPSWLDWLIAATYWLTTVFATTFAARSVVAAFRTIDPMTRREIDRSGLIYFGDVAASKRDDWERRALKATAADIQRDLAEQVHTTATIARNKHRNANRAIRDLVRFALPAGLILYVLSHALA